MTTKRRLRHRYGHMAYDRNTFKDRIEEYVSGACLEFYKARLAKKNGHTRWVAHWMNEARGLLDRALTLAVRHRVRGFKDKRKAASEVIDYMQRGDASFRRQATNIIVRDFKVKKLRIALDQSDYDAFWAWVEKAIDDALIEGDFP